MPGGLDAYPSQEALASRPPGCWRSGEREGLGWFSSFFEFCATSKMSPSSALPAVGVRLPWKDWDGPRGK